MIQSVVLFNGTAWIGSPAWTFEYSSRNPGDSPSVNYGDLTRITLPLGGTLSYTWDMVSACDINSPTPVSRGVTSRTVDANDGFGPRTWNYSGHVTDPDGNETIHTFTPLNGTCSYYETQTKYYQGSAQSGTLLKTVNTDYQSIPSPFDTLNPSSTLRTVTNVFPIRITTIWPSGKTTKIEKDYDSNLVFSVPGGAWTTASYGNVIEVREYDYGDGINWTLLRRTRYTYKAFDGSPGSSSYLAANLLDLVSSVTTYDGNGNQVAKTTHGYDEFPLQPSGIATQHDTNLSFSTLPRGNRTSESHWLNTTGGMLTSTATYYDTGTPYQMTDPGGHTTTNFYDPGFQSLSNFAGAYVTHVQNALQQTSYFDYDLGTGLRTALKDANGQVSTWDYDFFNRTLHSHAPNGATTTWTYNDTQPPTFTASSTITSTLNRLSEADLDGLGRLVHAKLLSDPDGVDTTDTTYDKLGRVSTASNPHRPTASFTDGVTTTYYDALGRVVQVAPQDGTLLPAGTSTTQCQANNVCSDYSNFPWVTVTDQAGHQRRSRTDALGRLVEVDEPGVVSAHNANNYATLQTDGNFVLYDPTNNALWATGTSGTNVDSARLQDDGNFVLYGMVWLAGTYTPPNGIVYGYDGCRVGQMLFAGQTLASNACLESSNGRFMLLMQSDGNFFIYDRSNGNVPWSANTYGHPGAYALMQTDGNLVVYAPNGVPLWASATSGSGAGVADMRDDGRLTLERDRWDTHTAQSPVSGVLAAPACSVGTGLGWTGQLQSGKCLASPNGHYQLLMQTDGNLVLSDIGSNPARTLWSTNTALTPFSPGIELVTLYSYDALGNLLCVEQHGDSPPGPHADGTAGTGCSATPDHDATSTWRVRRFTYDSLSRLLTATNPESGKITYTYDADGNLLMKTSPKANELPGSTLTQTISYCYDELHRVTEKDYQPHTYSPPACPITAPVVSYTYDQGTNGIGRMTGLTDQAGTGIYTYDLMGRSATEQRTISGISQSLSYEYNLDGSLWKLHYPSTRTVTYTPNAAGRIITAADSNGTNYVSGATYNPAGALTGFTNGTNIVSSFLYNPRLQLCRITAFTSGSVSPTCDEPAIHGNLMDRGYNFNLGAGDNGNVIAITNYRDTSRSQAFTYDALNRITSGWTTGNTGSLSWGENYTIDAWGNLMIAPMSSKAHGGNFQCAGDNNNHTTCLSYDPAGNVTANGGTAYSFDQENRLSSTAGTNYVYDADGNRVKKSSGSTGTLYWYASPGIIAETDLNGTVKSEYVFFGGKRVARIDSPGNSVHYYLSDHLSSTTMVASSAGAPEEESDYSPFGTEYPVTSTGTNHYKFTSKARDTETGLDYFGARDYSSGLGRYTSADEPGLDQHRPDPQSWNLYMYARNNPLLYVDPNGEYICGSSMTPQQCTDFQKGLHKAQAEANQLKDAYGADSTEYKDAQRAIDAYGRAGVDNGVTIEYNQNTEGYTQVYNTVGQKTKDNPTGQHIVVTMGRLLGNSEAEAHEGSHVADGSAWVKSGFSNAFNPTLFATEYRAYQVYASLRLIRGDSNANMLYGRNYEKSFPIYGNRREYQFLIRRFLEIPKSEHGYGLKWNDKTPAFNQPKKP